MLHGLLRLFLVLLTICYSLARRKTSAELLDAQQRGARVGAHKLEVRTDFRSDIADHLVSEWTLRNACVTFHNWRGTLHRAQFVSLENISAVIHSFSEYSFGFGRLAFVRPCRINRCSSSCSVRSAPLAWHSQCRAIIFTISFFTRSQHLKRCCGMSSLMLCSFRWCRTWPRAGCTLRRITRTHGSFRCALYHQHLQSS